MSTISRSSIFYFFRESLTGFTRNLSTTLGSIITIFLSLLIIGIFCIAGAVVNNVVASVENQVSITAYVKDDASDADIEKVKKTIEGYDGVESVSFTTKDQALDNFRKSTSNPEIVDQLDGENPLPASIYVQLDDAQSVQNIASDRTAKNQSDHLRYRKCQRNPGLPKSQMQCSVRSGHHQAEHR